jgi:hypothetical protein
MAKAKQDPADEIEQLKARVEELESDKADYSMDYDAALNVLTTLHGVASMHMLGDAEKVHVMTEILYGVLEEDDDT